MNDLLPLILQYGYLILFAFVTAEQVGLPVPDEMKGRILSEAFAA